MFDWRRTGGGTRRLHQLWGRNRIDVRVDSQNCSEWYQRYRTKLINANDNEMALAVLIKKACYEHRNRSPIGKGGQLFALVCSRHTHKGFQVHSSTNKGNNSAISCTHSAHTFVFSKLIKN